MKVTELRIGNLIYNEVADKFSQPIKEIYKVEGRLLDIMERQGEVTTISPIELTQEWLLKLGFNNEYKKGYIGIDVCNTDFVLLTPENETASHAGTYRWAFKQDRIPLIKEIESVHELQNLFYAVSGVELTLKEL